MDHRPCGEQAGRGLARHLAGRDNQLAGFEHGQFVHERVCGVGAGVFGGGKLACRQVQQRDTDGARRFVDRWGNRHQKRRLARVEVADVDERAG